MFFKKFISFILLFTMFLSLFSMQNVALAKNNDTDNIITAPEIYIGLAKFTEKVGTNYKSKRCLRFVSETWAEALPNKNGWKAGNCCATSARKSHKKSTSSNKYDYPLGAAIYFSGSDTKCKTCGTKDAGHIGIYVGDGCIVHCYDKGKILNSKITEVISDGYTYMGWGYPSGKKLEIIKENDSTLFQQENTKISNLAIDLTSQLDTTNYIHTEGNNLGLRGTITSSYNLLIVCGYVKDYNGRVILSSVDTNLNSTKKLEIKSSNLNKHLTFRTLEPGEYSLIVFAKDSSGTTKLLTQTFEVVANNGIVTGTVINLNKLGWKNVSIRTGASTNYKIIGNMTTGQQCKIYLNKSTTNWYYIEYNGIKGYASKKGFSI